VEGISPLNIKNLEAKRREIRRKVLDYHVQTRTSHVGSSLSCVEILTALYYHVLSPGDSFVLSKGHAAGTLYVILLDKGLIPPDQMGNLEQHPSLRKEYGIEATTGSLGHGLSIGLGIALAEKKSTSYVLMSDGECDEGQVWEAARLASQLNIKNLVAIVDCNGWQAFKRADISGLAPKFSAFGWEVVDCDGHQIRELIKSLKEKRHKARIVLARTVKGKGIKRLEDKLESHYAILDAWEESK
jgi:transketolase